MAKKKKNGFRLDWIIGGALAILLIIIVLLIYTGNFNINFNLEGFNPFGSNYDLPPLPPDSINSCSDVDIYSEYLKHYGATIISQAKTSCEAVGVYYDDSDVSGCAFDPDLYTVDCDGVVNKNLESFCESLNAEWVCDNSNGFIGCVCDAPAPVLQCEYVLIAQKSVVIPPFRYYEYSDSVPKGKYRFEWSFNLPVNTDILNGGIVQSYVSATSGHHPFTEPTGDIWGIGLSNNQAMANSGNVKLYQWQCAGDPQNWNPTIFDTPDIDEPLEINCDLACANAGYGLGGYQTDNCNAGEVWLDVGCCCYDNIL